MPAKKPKKPKMIFGKIVPGKPLSLRSYEKAFRIGAREGANAWVSKMPPVQKLLDHLGRFSQSMGSRESYLRNLEGFCKYTSKTPGQLVKLKEDKLSELVQQFAADMKRQGRSRSHINGVIKRLKTFARCNKLALDVQPYHLPTRYRRVPEYIPTKDEVYAMASAAGNLRDSAIVLCLWSSGLRVSTLLALDYKDVKEELEADETIVTIPVYPDMRKRVPEACKGELPYTSFICPEAVNALKVYLKEREERFGPIEDDMPLFTTDWNLIDRPERIKRRSTRITVSKLVHRTARRAGIKQWEDIHPHSLRKAFKSLLIASTVDGSHMDVAVQEYLFGHVLPGSQDPYFDKDKLDLLKAEYSKLNFDRESMGSKGADSMLKTFNRLAGKDRDGAKILNDYVRFKHGTLLPWKQWDTEKMAELMDEASEWLEDQEDQDGAPSMAPQNGVSTQDKVIEVDELEEYLERGWVFVSNVGSERCVVRQVQSTRTTSPPIAADTGSPLS